jgi:lipopolysaccharide export system protein LptA
MTKILRILLPVAVAAAAIGADEVRAPISSRWGDLDYGKGITHYAGTVVVDIPGLMKLTCEDLVAVQATGTNRLETLTALTNVVMDLVRPGRTPADPPIRIHATADMAVFTGSNSLVTLTGPFGNEPRVETPQARIRGSTITYNLSTSKLWGTNYVTEINADLFKNSGLFGRTNKAAKKDAP